MSLSIYHINHVHRVYKNRLRSGKPLENQSAPDMVNISPEARRRLLADKAASDVSCGPAGDGPQEMFGKEVQKKTDSG